MLEEIKKLIVMKETFVEKIPLLEGDLLKEKVALVIRKVQELAME